MEMYHGARIGAPHPDDRRITGAAVARSFHFDEMAALARHLSLAENLWQRSKLRAELATVARRYADVTDKDVRANSEALDAFLISQRLRAIDDELAFRDRARRTHPGDYAAAERGQRDLAELAAEVKRLTDLAALMRALGFDLRRVGRDHRRGGDEFAGPCPLCRDGDDRLRVWSGPPDGRCWCRVCGWSADAISLAMSFAPGCGTFREAVHFLADAALIARGVPA